MDIFSREKRSHVMAQIRGRDTKPELLLRRSLWAIGFRYSLHRKGLPGRPDLVLTKWNAVIFVHGCFWHAHENCAGFRLPKSRVEFWQEKLDGNRTRDEQSALALVEGGWSVAVVWECAIEADVEKVSEILSKWLRATKRVNILEVRSSTS
ncbi:very short patch repair endonuclease [Lysobacter soyae]|uniref:very short patch repair endonuclease n=1 Tax=Lysobacter soyae TaxID=2764185 RepID=UPI0021034C27|nr:very short patch repair endonuclease [Lysobacter sp. CJ11]